MAVYENIDPIHEILDLDKAKVTGEIYTGSHQKDNHQRQFAYDGKTGIPLNVGRKSPHQVGQILKYRTYDAYQFIHTPIPFLYPESDSVKFSANSDFFITLIITKQPWDYHDCYKNKPTFSQGINFPLARIAFTKQNGKYKPQRRNDDFSVRKIRAMHIYIFLNKKPDKTPGSPGHLIRP